MNDTKKSLPTTEITIEIPFFDVDLMGVAWHGHYVKYFEVARGALMDKFSYGYAEMAKSGYSWPVVELKLRYVHPARLGQKITIRAIRTLFRVAVDFGMTSPKIKMRKVMIPVTAPIA